MKPNLNPDTILPAAGVGCLLLFLAACLAVVVWLWRWAVA